MLRRTNNGVEVVRDWSPERIGTAYRETVGSPGEGMVRVQAALLARPQRPLLAPRKVQVLSNVERLVAFLKF